MRKILKEREGYQTMPLAFYQDLHVSLVSAFVCPAVQILVMYGLTELDKSSVTI